MAKEIQYRKLTELKKLPNNPRTIKKDDMERLKKSIKDNPDYFEARPIILSNRTGELVILAGNQRYEAAKALKMEEVPTFLLEGLTEAREREIIIRDNVSNGDWDMDVLANEWDTQELTDWGLDLDWDEPEQEAVEDEAPEVDESEPPKSELGKVYQLGNHRLMCGDSTDAGSVAILMDGQKADMVFTDPPYGMNLDTDYSKMPGAKTHYSRVIGDDKEFDMNPIFEAIQSPVWYIWGADYLYKTIPKFDQGNYIVWSKRMSDEENAVFGSAYELVWTFPKRKKEIWFVRGINQQSERLGEHPTQKPIELCVRALRQNEQAKNIVDVFGGSGSTLIACEQLGRKCYMMELDPKYCDVIRKRYWKFVNGSEEGWEDGTK